MNIIKLIITVKQYFCKRSAKIYDSTNLDSSKAADFDSLNFDLAAEFIFTLEYCTGVDREL